MVLQDDLRQRYGVLDAVRRDGADLGVVGARHGWSTSRRPRERAELRCPPAAIVQFRRSTRATVHAVLKARKSAVGSSLMPGSRRAAAVTVLAVALTTGLAACGSDG